jgi:hypothetical protein
MATLRAYLDAQSSRDPLSFRTGSSREESAFRLCAPRLRQISVVPKRGATLPRKSGFLAVLAFGFEHLGMTMLYSSGIYSRC